MEIAAGGRITAPVAFAGEFTVIEVEGCRRLVPDPGSPSVEIERLEFDGAGPDTCLAAAMAEPGTRRRVEERLLEALRARVGALVSEILDDANETICARTATGRGVWSRGREKDGGNR